ncbi:hypothetical protein O0I10_010215 [Lichtheimia ornata]|uniref:NOT2/NOT3/NOT5 C-terminal domain-containing protein n=1 Tax=Lichtheimia ornata TaxID=688661 RepID=A0AAD7XRJ2_9FUNG|nr:uncharacterized protein O0I10_010215 [Lichtheimia ornata]KAJ8654139.1 hypothetical protein O0I10_010215 [Lichtheimia ornata]
MFRPNTGIDLNDFPALGSPASSTRTPNAGSLPPQPPSSSLLPSNRFANYPSTPSNSTHLQDALLGTGSAVTAAGNSNAAVANEFGVVSGSSPLGSYQPVHSATAAAAAYAGHGDHHVLANARSLAPRTFSMDEFPALRSSSTAPGAATPFGNDLSAANSLASKGAVGGEPWDYASARDSMSSSKQYGAPGIRNDMLGSSQWSRGSNAGESTPSQSRKSVGSSLAREQDGKTSSTTPVSGASSGSNSDVKSGDSYGLLGLLGVIRMTDPDRSMLALGSDLTTLGLDLNTADSIYSTFISPWSDTQTPPGLNVEPGYYLPPCYRTVHATPPAHQRMRTFSDEILFYVFYSMPKDVAQEAAAQELYARNWRYHKELGMWLTKETDENGRPVQGWRRTTPNPVDRGVYVIFDPTSWSKVKREWTLPWDALEERQPQPQQQSTQSGPSSQPRPQQQQPQQQPGMSMSNTPTGISPGLASRGVMI